MSDLNSVIKITAQTDDFVAGTNKAQKSLLIFDNAISKSGSNLDIFNQRTENTTNALLGVKNTTGDLVNTFTTVPNTLAKVENNLKNVNTVSTILDQSFVKLGANVTGFSKQTSLLGNVLSPANNLFYELERRTTGTGKALQTLSFFEKPLVGAFKNTSIATANLSKNLATLGPAGNLAAQGLSFVSKKANDTAGLISMTDTINDLYTSFLNIKEAMPGVAQGLGDVASVAGGVGSGIAGGVGIANQMTDAKMKVQLAATAANAVGRGKVKAVGGAVSGLMDKTDYVLLAKGIADAAIQVDMVNKGVYKGIEDIQSLGFDTSLQNMTLALGGYGEGLLGNIELTKQFTAVSTQLYTQLEDSVAFIKTLPSGQEAGSKAIIGNLRGLVNDKLDNAISSDQAAGALYQSISAGVGAKKGRLDEATPFMEAAGKLAIGTDSSIDLTVESLAKLQNAYGETGNAAMKNAAIINGIVEQGQVTFDQLVGSIGRVGSVASQTGQSAEGMSADISFLTQTMAPPDAMTSYVSLLQSVAGQAESSGDAARELGVQFDLQAIKAKGLTKAVKDLYDAAGGSSAKIKEVIPDSTAYLAAITLAKGADKVVGVDGKGGQGTILGNIKASAADPGSIDKLFEERQSSTIKQIEKLQNGFKELYVEFGEKFIPLLKPGIEALNEILDRFQKMPDSIKSIIGGIVVFNLAVDKTKQIIFTVIGAAIQLGSTLLIFKTMKFFGAAGGILPGITALQSAFAAASVNTTGFKKVLLGLGGAFQAITGANLGLAKATDAVVIRQGLLGKAFNAVRTAIWGQNAATDAAVVKVSALDSAYALYERQQTARLIRQARASNLADPNLQLNRGEISSGSRNIAQRDVARVRTSGLGSNFGFNNLNDQLKNIQIRAGAAATSIGKTLSGASKTWLGINRQTIAGLATTSGLLGKKTVLTYVQVGATNSYTVAEQRLNLAQRLNIGNLGNFTSGLMNSLKSGKLLQGGLMLLRGGFAGLGAIMNVVKGGAALMWAAIGGPVTAIIAGVVAAALAIRDFIPGMGGVLDQNIKIADSFKNIGKSSVEMSQSIIESGKSTREYEGILNNWILKPLNGLTNLLLWIPNLFFDLTQSVLKFVGLGGFADWLDSLQPSVDAVNKFFNKSKDIVQDYLDEPIWTEIANIGTRLQPIVDAHKRVYNELKIMGNPLKELAKQQEKQLDTDIIILQKKRKELTDRLAEGTFAPNQKRKKRLIDDNKEIQIIDAQIAAGKKQVEATKKSAEEVDAIYKKAQNKLLSTDDVEKIKNSYQTATTATVDGLNAQIERLEEGKKEAANKDKEKIKDIDKQIAGVKELISQQEQLNKLQIQNVADDQELKTRVLQNTQNSKDFNKERQGEIDSALQNVNKEKPTIAKENLEVVTESIIDVEKNMDLVTNKMTSTSNVAKKNINALNTNLAALPDMMKRLASVDPEYQINQAEAEATVTNVVASVQSALGQGLSAEVGSQLLANLKNQTITLKDGTTVPLFSLLSANGQQEVLELQKNINEQAANDIIAKNEKITNAINAQKQRGVLFAEDAAKQVNDKEIDNNIERLKAAKKNSELVGQQWGKSSQQYIIALGDEKDAEDNLYQSRLDSQNLFLDKKLAEQQRYYDRLNKQDALSNAKGLLSNQDKAEKDSKNALAMNLKQQQDIKTRLEASRERPADLVKYQNELLDKQTEYEQEVTNNLSLQVAKRISILQAGHDKEILQLTVTNNALEYRNKLLSNESEILNNKRSLLDLEQNYLESSLQISIKLTGDSVKKAELEEQISAQKLVRLDKEYKIQQKEIIIKEKLFKLDVQKQQNQLKQALLNNKLEQLQAKYDLSLAKRQGKSKEEIEMIQVKVDGLIESRGVLEDEGDLLIENKKTQAETLEINKQQVEQQYKINKKNGLIDQGLTNLNKKLAIYDKEIKKIDLSSQKEEAKQAKTLKYEDLKTAIYEKQDRLLNNKLSNIEQETAFMEKQFGVLGDMTKDETKKNNILRKAIDYKLKSLQSQQKIERELLDNEIERSKIAQKRRDLELESQERKQKTEVMKANLAVKKGKLQLEKGQISAEDLEILEMELDNKVEDLKNTGFDRNLAKDDRKLLDKENRAKLEAQDTKQYDERFDLRDQRANTTPDKWDNYNLKKEVEQNIKRGRAPDPGYPSTSRINIPKYQVISPDLTKFFKDNGININGTNAGQSQKNVESNRIVNFNPTINLDINQDIKNVDPNKTAENAKNSLQPALYDLLQKVNQELSK